MTELLITDAVSIQTPFPSLSDEEFFDFCASNQDYRIERTATGRIVIMPGAGGRTGSRNADVTAQVHVWARRDGRGIAFDSSTLFRLANSAMRSPDAAWVDQTRLRGLTDREKDRYLPLCPGFVIELTSPSDRLPEVREKMEEWMAMGCQLGWILHPPTREVHIYRPSGVEVLREATMLHGEGPVEGFVLDLRRIWDPGW